LGAALAGNIAKFAHEPDDRALCHDLSRPAGATSAARGDGEEDYYQTATTIGSSAGRKFGRLSRDARVAPDYLRGKYLCGMGDWRFSSMAANIYAGWEIGVFRQWPPAVVAVIAAVVPIIGPAIFLAMPTHRVRTDEAPLEAAATEEAAIVTEEAPPAAVEEHSAKPALPETVTYPRGQFTFNRRFFETKFAGFLKMVPGEAERDKVIFIKSARGEYTGHRFSKVEPNEVFLQIRKGTATEEVMIPFSEIYEVQIRHKDA
jgi:hypothetical protein